MARFLGLLMLLLLHAFKASTNCGAASKHQASTCSELYTVKQGDTCSSMRAAAKLSMKEFLAINPVLNCSLVQVGDLICLAPCSPHASNMKRGGLLVDYIGAIGVKIELSEVPIKDELTQFLILAFSIDANASGVPQDGHFSPYWVSYITPESVAALKSKHPNVRVLMSLAGYSIYDPSTAITHVVDWYDPKDPKAWLKNALKTVGSLVETYHLDGIDIDYETFPQSNTFARLIGTLIKKLKKQKTITLATMAPFESVVPYYSKLYKLYHRQFDYVNYQFYANNFSSAAQYVEAYNGVVKIFPRDKLLASLEVGKTARGPSPDVFFNAFLQLLKEPGSVPGLFLWSADHSKAQGFLVEKVAQCIM